MLRFLPLLLLFFACEPAFDTEAFGRDAQVLGSVAKISRAAVDRLGQNPGGAETDLPYAIDQNGQALTSQVLRNDAGNWLHLLVDAADLDKVAGLEFAPAADYPEFPSSVQAYLGKRLAKGKYESITTETRPDTHLGKQDGPDYLYQGEGPIWENDLVGFRTYFDNRNGYDIFGKTTDRFVASEISVKGNYHEMLDWGMDVLKVGNSFGAGELGLYAGDTIRHLGDARQETFRILENGPLLASFELAFRQLDDFPGLAVTRKVTILKGLPGYLSENTLTGSNGETLATGIVTLNEHTDLTMETDDFAISATHGPQAELGKYLGMAVVTTTPVTTGKTPDKDAPVTTTNFVRPTNGEPSLHYLFLAGWELQDAAYTSEDTFLERATEWAAQYRAWTTR